MTLLGLGAMKWTLLLSLSLCLLYAAFSLLNGISIEESTFQSAALVSNQRRICNTYPDDGKIAISVKTGATEAPKKLPTLLKTSLSCVEDVMVFSDLDQTIDNVQLHNVLSKIPLELTKENPDFDIYFKQIELASQERESEIESLSSILAPPRGPETHGKNAAWALDKYKFTHMLNMAFELQPNRDWYVFLETDTYLCWANLKRWLATQNPGNLSYIGNAVRKSNRPPLYFAHGGSGFVLSGATMKEFALNHTGAAQWTDPYAKNWWAGDMMLADVLYREMLLQVTDMSPMIFHLEPAAPELETDALQQPAIMVHPVQSEGFARIHEKERQLDLGGIQIGDVLRHLTSG